MKHQHQYDAQGNQLCCTKTGKVYQNSERQSVVHDACCSANHRANVAIEGADHHEHDHTHAVEGSPVKLFLPSVISLGLLLTAIVIDNFIEQAWFSGWFRILWYVIAYLPVGYPVLKDAWFSIKKGSFFSEFFLMGIATLGAFAIGEYPEAVAVMLFYSVGENFQSLAVSRAKANIKALLDERPDEATVVKDGIPTLVPARSIEIGTIVQLKPGEKLALDAVLFSERASFNTAALTGESKPETKKKDDVVLAGMINLNTVSQVKVTTAYEDSKLSKILELVQDATAQKAPTELFISRFAKVYTPVVVFLAIGITLLPALFVGNYVFTEWLYRALVFLVISCPCALVISIPLGYFGGIGAASKHGILVKGSNFLDTLASIQHVVMDKTGTMTEGVFRVQDVIFEGDKDKTTILGYVNLLESNSTHPVATAIHEYVGTIDRSIPLTDVEEIAGHGLKGSIDGKILLVGNFKLMDKFAIHYTIDPQAIVYTTIAVAFDNTFVGYITIADSMKEDAPKSIYELHRLGVKTTMLSGDKATVVAFVANTLGVDNAYGDLLPEDKVDHVKAIKTRNERVAFVGDGVNDAPVVALSDVGIAMGGLGSDATIETADVVIQDDKPSKIPVAIRIGKKTKRIVWENIGLAFGVKAVVLVLGAGGLATMWEAVFADVGVALLAILNAIRIQHGKYTI